MIGNHQLIFTDIEYYEVFAETQRLTISPRSMCKFHTLGIESGSRFIECERTCRSFARSISDCDVCTILKREFHYLLQVVGCNANIRIRRFPPCLAFSIPVVHAFIVCHICCCSRRFETRIESLFHSIVTIIRYPCFTLSRTT